MKTSFLTSIFGVAAAIGLTFSASAADAPTAMDEQFVQTATISNLAEIELGKVAGEKATAGPVQDFGRMMVVEHQKAKEQLEIVAKEAGIEMPTSVDEAHEAKIDKLEDAKNFDAMYMTAMVKMHQNSVELFEKAAEECQNPALKGYAAESLPALREHLAKAEAIKAGLKG